MPMNPISKRLLSILLPIALLSTAPAAFAQDEADGAVAVSAETGGIRFSLDAGILHQFRADLDDGGSFSVLRSGVRLNLSTALTEQVHLSITGRYRHDDFNFRDAALGLPDDPWGSIHTAGVEALFTIGLSAEWRLFIGPTIQSSWENGASMSDGMTYGGLIGFTYRVSETLSLGLLASVRDELEDSVSVVVLPMIDWRLTDEWRLGTVGGPSSLLVSGVQLSYDAGDGWRFGVGVGYSRGRFRLDDDGTAPDGIGEESGLPVWFGIGYRPSNQFEIDLVGGVLIGGELRLEDEDGRRIASDDHDPAAFIGIAGRLSF